MPNSSPARASATPTVPPDAAPASTAEPSVPRSSSLLRTASKGAASAAPMLALAQIMARRETPVLLPVVTMTRLEAPKTSPQVSTRPCPGRRTSARATGRSSSRVSASATQTAPQNAATRTPGCATPRLPLAPRTAASRPRLDGERGLCSATELAYLIFSRGVSGFVFRYLGMDHRSCTFRCPSAACWVHYRGDRARNATIGRDTSTAQPQHQHCSRLELNSVAAGLGLGG